MAKEDLYFAISTIIALIAVLGIDWRIFRKNVTMRPIRSPRFRPALVLVLVIASLAMSSFGWYSVHHNSYFTNDWMGIDERWKLYKKVDVWNKHYLNEAVEVDGHRYINCTFENVTFVYNATAPWEFTGASIVGSIHIKTDNRRLGAFLEFLKITNSLSPEVPVDLHP